MPKVRSVFLSDIHLGTRACQADRLLDFLREHPAEQTYLVGDIIDFWAMSRSISWSQAQNTVVQKLLRRARHGERVVFIPGNHDEALREAELDPDPLLMNTVYNVRGLIHSSESDDSVSMQAYTKALDYANQSGTEAIRALGMAIWPICTSRRATSTARCACPKP